ncbi:MAG: transglutaminase family protein [Bacteroidetes bacterium]|nr:transglutaminase family protein [Bacteroidota bacterium]
MEINKIKALIDLLDDPDREIFETVKNQILRQGMSIIPELEKSWEGSLNNDLQNKIENIIQQIQFRDTADNLQKWEEKDSDDILLGAFLTAKYQYPDLEFSKILKQIEIIKQDVWLELNNNLTALEKIKILNHIFYDIHHFTSNTSNLHTPQNSYINIVLDSKKGNAISLAIIYIYIAQSLGLPIYGVDLPKNIILAYIDNPFYKKTLDINIEQNILFYINPFNKGAVFGQKEIDFFIEQKEIESLKQYYYPCSNKVIINRLINDLIVTYNKLGYPNKIKDLKLLQNILKG